MIYYYISFILPVRVEANIFSFLVSVGLCEWKITNAHAILNNYFLKSRWIVAKYSPTCEAWSWIFWSHYLPRLKRIIVLAYTNSVTTTHEFTNSKQEFSVWSLLISPNVSTVKSMRSQLAASFPCAIYAWNLQFAQRWRLGKRAKSS